MSKDFAKYFWVEQASRLAKLKLKTLNRVATGSSNPIHELLHGLFLFLDGFDEAELRAAAVEVVPGPMDAEIGVARQMVGQKPDANGEGDELAGKGDERFLGG